MPRERLHAEPGALRLLECCRLRVKDVDLERGEIVVRNGKGGRDRVTMLPVRLVPALAAQLERVRAQHARDLGGGTGSVELPLALERKYPRAPYEIGWQWVFPATRFYTDAASGRRRRHHLHESVLQRAMRGAVRGAASRSLRAATRFGTRSRHTCSRTATTSGRSRSCSAIAM